MKKIILGIVIGFVVIIGGCVAFLGAGVSSVDNAINDVEKQTAKVDSKLEEMTKDIKWEVKKDSFSTKIVGTFENTSDETIDYVQFDYKLMDKDGTVIESSFTNETDVAPKEKRKIEILCIENNFDTYTITSKSSAF
ncbi:FxLYD domain-containing protein [[Clostridium] dakarense]|uniref:FxLYD domain-containing protein n=1 Tax=Faecalimicrobium dakarense TaxID=1301100 RepID=UPI0004B97E44|nr:FxLYD domain-containing protein [[Clostridium] dakarense]